MYETGATLADGDTAQESVEPSRRTLVGALFTSPLTTVLIMVRAPAFEMARLLPPRSKVVSTPLGFTL